VAKPSTTASLTSALEEPTAALLFHESREGNGEAEDRPKEGQQDLFRRHRLGEAHLRPLPLGLR